MSVPIDVTNLLIKKIAVIETQLRASGSYQAADLLFKLKGPLEQIAATYSRDYGNVLPGFVDRNAELRSDINTLISTFAGEPIAAGVNTGAAALLAIGNVPGAVVLEFGDVVDGAR
jgi:hypothetical protein